MRIPDVDSEEPQEEVDEAAAAFGLVIEEPIELEDVCYLWPECVATFNFWNRLQTQWHRDMNGSRMGLNYASVLSCMDLFGVKKKNRSALFREVQAMEFGVLEALAKQR